MSSCSEAQAQLPTDHHGLVDAPVLAADRTPALCSSHLHQHLHAAFGRLSASCQTHLNVDRGGDGFVVPMPGGLCEHVTHRGLDAGVGDAAAHGYILAVLAAVKWHRPEGALRYGLFPACALDTVHVDWTGTCRRGGGAD